ARDLMQETFTRTWEYLTAHEPPEHLRAFLYRVAHNLIVDHVRKAKTHPAHSLDELQESGFEPAAPDTGEAVVMQLDAESLMVLLKKLEAKDRDIIVMRYMDELTPKEIAVALGESENVVSVRLHRAVAKARTLI
ncbi:sigma-70 family RNA polymerase sigma factor, partial [Candidatus Berkelbacteria bacterium]|nr:sigma-70 family RNA polymerase sigma factor [Candidatus Berkelbacteria bacterium]